MKKRNQIDKVALKNGGEPMSVEKVEADLVEGLRPSAKAPSKWQLSSKAQHAAYKHSDKGVSKPANRKH